MRKNQEVAEQIAVTCKLVRPDDAIAIATYLLFVNSIEEENEPVVIPRKPPKGRPHERARAILPPPGRSTFQLYY